MIKRKLKKKIFLVYVYIVFVLFFINIIGFLIYYKTKDESLMFLVLVICLFIFLVLPVIYKFFKWYSLRFRVGVNVDKIRWRLAESNPYKFEEIIADLFKYCGYKSISTTPKSGDYGADIIMKKKGIKYIVQVKKYGKDNKIGRRDLQCLQGAAQHFQATGKIFVTYGFFTYSAIDYAKQHGIELLDHNNLVKMIRKSYNFFK